ncbi:phosphotransferase family protein [Bacillus sp. FJAT-44742]|uniref:phosphotransferase family protein n=1 Tax=Bacillus sp. FJAT-44742 TaxID=2014005 RepID=UPI000C238050|nr:phosphotransferase family protein [Bacillus sp. FJAT-44742]
MSSFTFQDTIPVREGEEVNIERLEEFLRKTIEDFPDEPLQMNQFPSGHSNLTYEVKAGDWEGVLRRPPLGPVAPKAHDMEREYQVLKALHPSFPLAPRPYVFSDDHGIIGSPFFVMERRRGVVIDTDLPESLKSTPEAGKMLSSVMVKTQAELHSLDYKDTPLVQMTKPDGFMQRQVQGWIKRYERAKTHDVPGENELKKQLVEKIPETKEASVIHYDFKFNNAMFDAADPSKIIGLFDWEMATVGDPLADLGVTLSYWIESGDPELLQKGFGKPPATVQPGFYTRRDVVEQYAKETGRDVENIDFYLTFAYFKLAVIAQQIYYRYKKGQTNDQRFSKFYQTTAALIQHADYISRKGIM